MLCLPSNMAPAALSLRTTSASCVGTRSLNKALPVVVLTPAVSNKSFSPIGMPCSGPRSLARWTSASASRACARADSVVTVMYAFSDGLSCSIRARQALVNSTGETFFRRTSAAASVMLSLVRSALRAVPGRSAEDWAEASTNLEPITREPPVPARTACINDRREKARGLLGIAVGDPSRSGEALARFDEAHSTRSRHEFRLAGGLRGDRDTRVRLKLGQRRLVVPLGQPQYARLAACRQS